MAPKCIHQNVNKQNLNDPRVVIASDVISRMTYVPNSRAAISETEMIAIMMRARQLVINDHHEVRL